MDTSRLPESMRQRIEQQNALPPLDLVKAFLRGFVTDTDGLAEIRADLARTASFSTRALRRDLAAIESLLAEPPAPGTLAQLVGWEANWALDDPSDTGAAEFLRTLAGMLREVIASAEPQRPRP